MSKYWSRIASAIEPYTPGEQPKDKKYIKLNTNESPYPPSPKVIEAITKAACGDLKLYPDPTCDELRKTVADYYGLKKEQVFAGNGSDEILAFSFMAFFDPGRTILFPDISYSFYPVYAKLFNIDYKEIALDSDFSIPVEEFKKPNGGVVIANPNAPTGKYLELSYIEEILKSNMDHVVIVDEAYIDFGGESAVKLIDRYPNLLVVHTLSKSRSLAGLRVGFALGHEELICGLDKVKNSFNSYTLDRLAMAGAIEAIKDKSYFEKTRQMVMATRERVVEKLREDGFFVIDSRANFIFISHPRVAAQDIFLELKAKGILVRYFKRPRIDNFLRVSIGNDEEMDQFIKAISEIVK